MNIVPYRRKMKVAYVPEGFIDWIVLFAVDINGFVQAMVMGADESRCWRDINDAIVELENPCASLCY